MNKVLDGVLSGKGFGQYIDEFSDISWPMEEASLLRFSLIHDKLYEDLTNFIKQFITQNRISISNPLVDDLIRLQKEIIVRPDAEGTLELNLCADIPKFIHSFRNGEKTNLNMTPVSYFIERGSGFCGDKNKYAHEAVWFGRKVGKFLYPLTQNQNHCPTRISSALTI